MARLVRLDILEKREADAVAKVDRDRRALGKLRRQKAQAEAATRKARWLQLGAVVEDVLGVLEPEQLREMLCSGFIGRRHGDA